MPNRKCTGANCPMQVEYVVPETCPEPEKCRYATFPRTNADRIRNMTDEELANFVATYMQCEDCWLVANCVNCGDMTCYDNILSFLRSPVEESEK